MTADRTVAKTQPKKRGRPVIEDNETVARILDSAEAVFAQHGFSGASMRAIARGAEVNQALVSYHFENKEGLFRSVVSRRADIVTAQRLERLHRHIESGELTSDGVLRALVSPSIELSADSDKGGPAYVMIIAGLNASTDELSRSILREQFTPSAEEFVDAFMRLNAGLSRKAGARIYNFVISVAMSAVVSDWRLERYEDGRGADPEGRVARIIDHVVDFCARGLQSRTKNG